MKLFYRLTIMGVLDSVHFWIFPVMNLDNSERQRITNSCETEATWWAADSSQTLHNVYG